MSMVIILAMLAGVLLAAAIGYTQRSRKNQEPIQLGVDKKFRP